ncbi:triple tyrosine motif-containing protein [Oceanobacillus kapialis]|uniref:Triple tyrosine motif-containing protein n=1 Tax=Oceanobacillus kapialis TaxID=481353 RepID=A0ABW5PXT6_9BACI
MKIKLLTLFLVALLLISGCSQGTSNEEVKPETNEDQAKIEKVIIEKDESQNLLVEATATGNNLNYAYYVFKDDEVIEKEPYSQNATFNYKVEAPGTYKIRVFVKGTNGEIVTKNTEAVEM